MSIRHFKTIIILTYIIWSNWSMAYAQHDSTYYVSYPKVITGRIYLSQKYTALKFKSKSDDYTLNYRPNTTLNLGMGATYKWATLNLAYGFGFINPDQGKGKTKYLDLQFHGYGQKFNIDVLGQFYRGFYLFPQGTAASADKYYIRPDLRVNIIGTSVQYIVNHRRFSFRAASIQNEWQKKSAGTFLLGLETYGGRVKADSTIVPTAINQQAAELNETRVGFLEIGPNVGYAYTLVIKENFFITASISASFDYGINTVRMNAGRSRSTGISPNTFFRLFTGYNTSKWAVSIVFVNNDVRLARDNSNQHFTLRAGNVRLNFVYRFMPSAREKKILEAIK